LDSNPPPPPPYGALIEKARKGGRLSLREASGRAGVSKATWIDNTRGWRKRGDAWEPTSPKPETIASMAHAVRVDPERLASEGEHPGAAEILGEIIRQEPAPEPAPGPPPAPPDEPSDVRLHLIEATDAALRTDADIIETAIRAGAFTPAHPVESAILRQEDWDPGHKAREVANFRARVAVEDARDRRRAQLPGVSSMSASGETM
jgi:hypothetical protein